MRFLVFICSLFLCFHYSYCQSEYEVHIPAKKLPQSFKYDPYNEYLEIVSKTEDETDFKPKDIKRYAEAVTYGKRDLMLSGNIYIGYDKLENYLNSILKKLYPAKSKQIHLYIVQDANMNAYAMHDGSLFVNIGLIANVKSEAALAIIIAHELAHYFNNDVRDKFFDGLEIYTRQNRNDNIELRIEHADFNRDQETRADKDGFEIAHKAGYTIKEGISNFNLLLFQEMLYKKKNGGSTIKQDGGNENTKRTKLLQSHPDIEKRIEYSNEWIKKHGDEGKVYQVADKRFFEELKEDARLQTLHVLLNDADYVKCIEKAFIFYIQNPKPIYTYFILESIRREAYIDTDDKFLEKSFILHAYKDFFDKKESIKHNISFFFQDEDEIDPKIKANLFDNKEVKLTTNWEAFDYFQSVAEAANSIESKLTIALFRMVEDKEADYKKWLREYADDANALMPEYAKALLKRKLRRSMRSNRRELVLVEDLSFVEDHYYGYHNRRILAQTRNKKYQPFIERIITKKFPRKELVFIEQMKQEDFQKFYSYRNATITTALIAYTNIQQKRDLEDADDEEVVFFDDDGTAGGPDPETKDPVEKVAKDSHNNKKKEKDVENKELIILNPNFWYFLKTEKIASIEYFDAVAFDDKSQFIPFSITSRQGSSRFFYKVTYYKFNGKSNEGELIDDYIQMKMTRTYLTQSIYNCLSYDKK